MPHQLAQCHGPLFLRERGHVGLNLVVEVQTALLQQQADRGRRERRRGRADPEPHFWRDGHPVLEIGPAKAFGPHDVARRPDRHRESGQVLLDEARTDDLPPLLHGVGPLWRRGRTRHGRYLLRVRVQRRCRGARYVQSPRMAATTRPTAPTISASQVCVRIFISSLSEGLRPSVFPYTRRRSTPLRRISSEASTHSALQCIVAPAEDSLLRARTGVARTPERSRPLTRYADGMCGKAVAIVLDVSQCSVVRTICSEQTPSGPAVATVHLVFMGATARRTGEPTSPPQHKHV